MISSLGHALGPPGRRRLLARAGLIALLLLAVTFPVATLAAPGARQAEPATALPAGYCYAWDFANDTGQDADDLHVYLQGVRQITEVYAGGDNPFGPPAATSGYDAALNAYRLEFTGGPVPAGDVVRLGICTSAPALQLDASATTPPFYWSLQGGVLKPAPLFVGLSWEWQAGGLRLTVRNPGTTARVLWSLDLLAADAAFALDDLTGDNLSTLPVLGLLVDDPVVIPAGGSQSFDVASDALSGDAGAWLVSLAVSAEDDLDNVAHLYSQATLPTGVIYLPLTLK